MKILFLILSLFSLQAIACRNLAPISAVEKYISTPETPGVECKDIPEDECICFDEIARWETAKVVEVYVNGKPKYGPKENQVECGKIEECESLRASHCEKFPDHEFIYAENLIFPGFEAYCTKITGYERVMVGHKATVDQAKEETYQANLKIQKEEIKLSQEKKKAIRDKLKSFDKSKLTTVAAVRDFLAELVELLKE